MDKYVCVYTSYRERDFMIWLFELEDDIADIDASQVESDPLAPLRAGERWDCGSPS